MADRATGPVKPPVIDLTARTASPRSEPKADTQPEPPDADIAAPNGRTPSSTNWSLLVSAGIGGAILGTILTYLLSTLFPLPVRLPAIPPDLTGAVNAQQSQLDTLTANLGTLQGATTKLQAELTTNIDSFGASIADLKAAIPAAPAPVDLAPLETELKKLQAQIDAMSAGASGQDASAFAKSLSDVEASLTSLTTRVNGVDSTLTALRSDLDGARQALTEHISTALQTETGPALKLPLILSGLSSAFESGKPFQTELSSLLLVVPDLTVSAQLRAAALTGMSRPDQLTQRFEAAVPEILAARGGNTDWTQNVVDWGKSLLALRPADEQPGDTPEAIVSRLEGAMSRHDYATALSQIDQLPEKMRAAAAPIGAEIALHADADKLLADLRAEALAPAGAAS